MQSLMNSWSALSNGRRMITLLSVCIVVLVVTFLARTVNNPQLSLLFGGLEPRPAGEIITSLDQMGVVYEVRGDAIYVDASQRDSLRMTLAGQGLPASNGQGYELLDSLTGFGTTSQMFDAAYWRAKEGELARTILTNPNIRAARVHISTPTGRPFQREVAPTAAITVQSTSGSLARSQVQALQYLVAAAVSGLSPGDVAVIDSVGGLLSGNDGAPTAESGEERADALRDRAERLLLARVGAGNAVVEISIDTITETETISERTIDPDSRIAISTDVQENTGTSQNSGGGDVTVASNVPDGNGAENGQTSQNENSETRSLTNYEVSETQRDVLRAPGDIRRLTVAVLVNHVSVTAADGTVTVTPRTPEELADLETLVSSAIGLDAARGDQITLRSLPFDPVPELGTAAVNPAADVPLDMMRLIQIGVLAAVALILGLFVVRPILSPRNPIALPAPQTIDISPLSDADSADRQALGTMAIAGPQSKASAADPVTKLREIIAAKEPEALEILQSWVEAPTEKEQA